MAKRDVDLVIRAKNEASKAVDSISKALRGLIDVQEDLSSSSGRVDTTLTKLKTALGGLNQQFRGMTAAAQMAATMDKARASMDRLEVETAELRQESIRYSVDARRAADVTGLMALSADMGAKALARAKGEMAETRTQQKSLNTAISEAINKRNQLSAADARITASIGKATASTAKAIARYRELGAQIKATAEPSATLVARFEKANQSVDKHVSRLAALDQKQAGLRQQMQLVNEVLVFYQGQQQKTAATMERQVAVISRLEAKHKELATAASTSAKRQGEIVGSLDRVNAALARNEQDLARARTNFLELQAQAQQSAVVLEKVATVIGSEMAAAVAKQQASLERAGKAYSDAAFRARQLGLAVSSTAQPTDKMVSDLNEANAALGKFKSAVDLERAALAQMETALRGAGGDINSLEAAMAGMIGITNKLEGELRQLGVAADSTGNRQRNLGSATAQVIAQFRGSTNVITQQAGAMRSATAGTQAYGNAVARVSPLTRTAMSWTSRFKAEVISLIAAYGGLFGAIQGIKGVISATVQLQAAQQRLGVIFEGDQGKAAQELEFLRLQADRLGLSFGQLTEQYTIFASNTLGTNIAGQRTRDIFVAISEAARVNSSSVEDTAAVFKALSQIASKGTVQMEELRGQLGDRMPAALHLMAEGLGITNAELTDMTKQGQITAEALIPFADAIKERYGPQLAEALTTTSAKLGMLANAGLQAKLAIGESGFIEAFDNLIDKLTEFLESAEGAAFFGNIGKVLAFLTNIVSTLVEHFRALTIAISAMIGLKLIPVITGMTRAFTTLQTVILGTTPAMKRMDFAMRTTTVVAGGLTGALARLRAGMIAFAVSNPVGLALTAAATIFGFWITSVDEGTEVLTEHADVMDQIKSAYNDAGQSIEGALGAIQAGTLTKMQKQGEQLNEQLEKLHRNLRDISQVRLTNLLSQIRLDPAVREEIQALEDQFANNRLSVDGFISALERMGQQGGDSVKAVTEPMIELLDASRELVDAADENRAGLTVLGNAAVNSFLDAKELLGQFHQQLKNLIGDEQIRLGLAGLLTGEVQAGVNELARLTTAVESGTLSWAGYLEAVREIKNENPSAEVDRLADSILATSPVVEELGVKVKESLALVKEGLEEEGSIFAQAFERLVGLNPFETIEAGAIQAGDAILGVADAAGKVDEPAKQAADSLDRLFGLQKAGESGPEAVLEHIREALTGIKEEDWSLMEPLEEMSEGAKAATGDIQNLGQSFMDVKTAAEESLPAIGTGFTEISTSVSPAVEATMQMAPAFAQAVTEFEKLHGAITPWGEEFKSIIAQVNEDIGGIRTEAEDMDKIFVNIGSGLQEMAEGGATLDEGFSQAAEAASLLGPEFVSAVEDFEKLNGAIAPWGEEFDRIIEAVQRKLESLRDTLESVTDALKAANAQTERAQKNQSGMATGGRVFGRGTTTSDSILRRLSRDEFVLKASAAKKIGYNLLNFLNRTGNIGALMPGMAEGGRVTPSGGGGVDLSPILKGLSMSSGPPLRPINVVMPDGNSFSLMGPEETAQNLLRYSRSKRITSAGRKPARYGVN